MIYKIKKVYIFIITTFVMMTFTSCSFNHPSKVENESNIVGMLKPQTKKTVLTGTWEISKSLSNTLEDSTDVSLVGKQIVFSTQVIQMGDNIWEPINYKVKRVIAEEYFLHKYLQPVSELGLKGSELFAVTVSSMEKYLYEFVIIDKDHILGLINDQVYYINKISDKTIMAENKKETEFAALEKNNQKESYKSVVLLGIKSQVKPNEKDQTNTPGSFIYRTFCISSENGNIQEVYEAPNIFLPRQNGFWSVKMTKKKIDNHVEDVFSSQSISVNNLTNKTFSENKEDFWFGRTGSLSKSISFIGNDYVSFAISGKGKFESGLNSWKTNTLRTYAIDSPMNSEGLKISDLSKESGEDAFNQALSEVRIANNLKTIDRNHSDLQRNFALYRKAGHWFIKGRLELEKENSLPYIDFNINLLPPRDIVRYDQLHISWTNIKDKVPQARDIITSPNNDFAVVLLIDELAIYTIKNENLSEEPVYKIPLNYSDTIVMAEWANGRYVRIWQDTFIKYNNAQKAEIEK